MDPTMPGEARSRDALTLVRPLSNLPEKPPSRPQEAFSLLTGNSLRRSKNE